MAFSIWKRASPHAGRVSVVVPLYNHSGFIGEVIASILAQGEAVREVIVIDNGSADDSARAMGSLATKDQRIRFRTQPNQGAHATLNAGLVEASGELLAILNSDDAYLPGRLNALASLLDEEQAADLAESRIVFIDGAGAAVANPWFEEAWAVHAGGVPLGVALVNANLLMTTSNFVFRRTLLDRVGLFAPLRYAHDLDFALRALALGARDRTSRPAIPALPHPWLALTRSRRTIGRMRAEWALAAAGYLTSFWDRPGALPIDWGQAHAVQNVLHLHDLTRAAALCMAALRRHGGASLDRNPLLADAGFKERLRE